MDAVEFKGEPVLLNRSKMHGCDTRQASVLKAVAPGAADHVFTFGPGGNAGWLPLVGDWDDDGFDTIGLFEPLASRYHLKNTLSGGAADELFVFGSASSGWLPLSGDWNANGADTIGLFDPATSAFHLKTHSRRADIVFAFGPGNSGWTPLTGDGIDTVGLYDPTVSAFHLQNAFAGGSASSLIFFGPANQGWTPLVGDWNGLSSGA